MRRLQFDGAWEGDCLPGGAFVAAYPDRRLMTHQGTWHTSDWIRYPRLSPVTGFVAGQTQAEGGVGRILEIRADGETDLGQACGNSATLYGPDGTLYRNHDCAAPYYGQGFRYFDATSNRAVPAWETYIDSSRQIYEYTSIGAITIGQGPESGVHILTNGRRYLLEPGTTTVVRFSQQGDQIAVGTFRHDITAFVAIWLTVAEIAALPDITVPVDPDPGPDPEPEPDMNFPVPEWNIVKDMHARFAATLPATEDGARDWTRMTIEQLKFSFPGGGWCWKSSTPNNPPSKDAIARQVAGRFECWDVLQAAGVNGPRVLANYPPSYHDIAGQHPIPVNAQDHLGDDPPDPPEPPSDDLEERVEQLELQQAALIAANAALADRVTALEQQVPPSAGMTPAQVVALIDAAFANADISGRTQSAGGFLSHSHGVAGLTITRKP